MWEILEYWNMDNTAWSNFDNEHQPDICRTLNVVTKTVIIGSFLPNDGSIEVTDVKLMTTIHSQAKDLWIFLKCTLLSTSVKKRKRTPNPGSLARESINPSSRSTYGSKNSLKKLYPSRRSHCQKEFKKWCDCLAAGTKIGAFSWSPHCHDFEGIIEQNLLRGRPPCSSTTRCSNIADILAHEQHVKWSSSLKSLAKL